MQIDEAFYRAIRNGDARTVAGFLDRRILPKAILHEGLLQAAEGGRLDMVRLLLDKGVPIDCTDRRNNTPLIVAILKRQTEGIDLLLQRGADVNIASLTYGTPLAQAARSGRGDLVEQLLAKGADVDAADTFHRTALEMAATWGHPEIARLLRDAGARVGIFEAAVLNDADAVRGLLRQGVEIDTSNYDGETPLMLAASCGLVDMVRLLLDEGADVNARDRAGRSALMHSAEEQVPSRAEVVHLLLDRGAEVNVKDANGVSALALFTEIGPGEIVQRLLDHGAELDDALMEYENGSTPLFWARKNGRSDVLAVLRKAGLHC